MAKWLGKVFASWILCPFTGHDWVYQYSFTARFMDLEYPFGGFRASCSRCGKTLQVRYTEHLEIRKEGGPWLTGK